MIASDIGSNLAGAAEFDGCFQSGGDRQLFHSDPDLLQMPELISVPYEVSMSEEEKANFYQQTQEKLAQKQQALIEPIQKKVEAEVKAVAESKGLQVVIDKSAVVYGGTDITQDVIRKMAK